MPSILLVDDDDGARQLFRREIEETGYYVTEAKTGREAKNAVQERFFDLLILDLSMPDYDGIELMQFIRAEQPHLKVLAVSGFMRGSFLRIANNLGASSTLEKPVTGDALMAQVYRLLATHP